MRRGAWRWLLGVLMVVPVLLVGSSAETQPAESIGTVTALEGRATVQHYGSATPQPLGLQSPVYQQDVVHTQAASKLQLTFADDTVVNLSEQSRLEITRFVYSPQEQTQRSMLTISTGVFRAIAQRLLPQSTFEVTTPTAIAAIRGTDFMAEVTPEATAVVTLEGVVVVFGVDAIFRGPVTLTEGMGSTVRRNWHPTPPNKWGEERIEGLRRATTIR